VRETAEGQLVRKVLERYGRVAREALWDWLPSKEPRKYLYDLVSDYPSRGGRMLRPSLCIATARVFGGTFEDALPAAVSIELLHNALLVHDDIEDESDERRGEPTLHRKAGLPLAINAGDSLAFLSLRPLLRAREKLGALVALGLLEELDRMAQETAEGQAIELGWRRDNVLEIGERDYLRMVLKKTCWLTTILPVRMGAWIGSRGEIDLDRFIRFGFFLGAAFQIQDDLLNLVGDHARYGKEIEGDLWEGKRTLMLIRLLERADGAEREELRAFLERPRAQRSATSVERVRGLMDRYGCIDHARTLAHGLAGAALHEIDLLSGEMIDGEDKSFLASLPTWVLERA
jgi:geranylgeranyl diphosphate synthase type II